MRDRPTRLSHQPHRLSPELQRKFLRLPDMPTSSRRDQQSRELVSTYTGQPHYPHPGITAHDEPNTRIRGGLAD